MKRLVALLASLCLILGIVGPAAVIAKSPAAHVTPSVKTSTDRAKAKLDKNLVAAVESGSNALVPVYATVIGKPDAALARLQGGRAAVAPGDKASLVVGRIRVQQLPKLAGATGVIRVGLIELKQTGKPLGNPDPDATRKTPGNNALQGILKGLKGNEVPYSKAPPIKTTNFEQLKQLALLDAKTHDFAEAWKMGYDGTGVTVSILDGGTDWGHPDLIGTWKLAANGWPRAFDPIDTLFLLLDGGVAPGGFVDQGLTWYVHTQARSQLLQTVQDAKKGVVRVSFATRTGPSRNFGVPSGTATHLYTFPNAWTKSGTVRLGSHPDDHLLALFGERPAVLVTDPHTAGVYDTVYVDLDNDHDLSDEKPVTRTSPVSYRDMNGDGYTDLSGGLLYYISDGTGASGTPLPGGPTSFGLSVKAAPGELLAWTGDFDPAIGGHGTLTASNVVGQGVIAGKAPTFGDVPGGTYPGAVIGGAPKAKAVPMGDIYFAFDFSTQFAYFLTNAADVNAISNSYGISDSDNDGFDARSQEAAIWSLAFGARTASLHAEGNGAPGYGTSTPPKPFTGIGVGASTQFGGTGWDSIKNASQITDNDVIPWSDRGPGATGATGVDVVADGAFAPGDITLNDILDGRTAWETWGGTSRSTPVATGAAALVYQAQMAKGAIPAGFAFEARAILKSSALDLGYDSYTQGAGSVQAGDAVKLTLGTSGAVVTPDAWRPGDYRGDTFDVFPHLLAAGASDSQTFSLGGSGTYSISGRYLKRVSVEDFNWTSANVAKESPNTFNAPDYLINLTGRVNDHPDADLLVVKAIYPHNELDSDNDYAINQRWTLLAYDWTDQNGDGALWVDKDHDGVVDHKTLPFSSNIDNNPDINFGVSEIQRGEYERFNYLRTENNEVQVTVRDPKQRMHDGLYLGLQHVVRSSAIPVTHLKFRIEFYKNVDWPWLTVPSSASGSFNATLSVPNGTPTGMYQGAIVVSHSGHDHVVPVSVTVPGPVDQAGDGSITGSLTFGGADVAEAQEDLTYDNGSIFGANDWSWRAESGDWRSFYFDVPNATPAGTLFLTDTTWDDTAPFTDLDTLIFGPGQNSFQLCCDPGTVVGGPYILDTVGSSANTNVRAGVWTFQTATGGAEEVVTGPASGGLHAVVQHGTGFSGDKFNVPFETTLGTASVNPASVSVTTAADSGSFDVTFKSSLDLPGLAAEGFGLSQPSVTTETAHQDNPNDPTTASVKKPFTLAHASRATISVSLAANDIDLYIVYDANHDGVFSLSEIVGSSAGGTGNELVTLVNPADGNYQAWVHGYSVTGTPTFPLTIDTIQGTDLTVSGLPSGAVAAGTPVTIHVLFSKTIAAGQDYFGELQLGPTTAPNALTVPIVIHRT
jgi:hypothetical protein